MVRLKLMPPLTRLVGAKEIAVDVGREPLKTVLERAAAGNAKFRAAILDARGRLSGEYSCLVNGRRCNVSGLDGVEVDENDEIVLLMPIAGGALAARLVPCDWAKGSDRHEAGPYIWRLASGLGLGFNPKASQTRRPEERTHGRARKATGRGVRTGAAE